jgi:hypothetical protein
MTARWLLVAALLLVGARAHASRQFPDDIASDLNLDYVPPCRLCHLRGSTGPGTVQTPFGLAARALGLQSGGGGRFARNSTLDQVLTDMAAQKIDSDGDGVSNVDELVAGTDPNTRAPVSLRGATDPPVGCAVWSASAGMGHAWPFLLAVAAVWRGRPRKRSKAVSVAR